MTSHTGNSWTVSPRCATSRVVSDVPAWKMTWSTGNTWDAVHGHSWLLTAEPGCWVSRHPSWNWSQLYHQNNNMGVFHSVPDPRGQKWHIKVKILRNFIFWSAGCSLLRAEGFFCNLDVLYWVVFDQIFFCFFSAVIFFSIFGHQNTGSVSNEYGSEILFFQIGKALMQIRVWLSILILIYVRIKPLN
jgi:hypothetical protein